MLGFASEEGNQYASRQVNIPASTVNAEAPPAKIAEKDFPDFENFEYPHLCFDGNNRPFTLKNGRYTNKGGGELDYARVKYADVTGDGKPEAMVILTIDTGGTAHPHCVFIFSLEDAATKRVKDLWDFETGDRADGGLRRIYGQDGSLIIERYVLESNWGSCCSKYFMREKYRWNGHKFQKEQDEKLDNPSRRADVEVEDQ